jgi:hypothetical protein
VTRELEHAPMLAKHHTRRNDEQSAVSHLHRGTPPSWTSTAQRA